ncbi:uncharacterized protein A4U43_C04F10190 [Asparagus officinalis]|uniref:Cytochrome P450 n=1 Tax=Asparagus officinalis TaxID=4686 RepID=A0A5P1F1J5_ASPOF|nr:uncharacterized protein A4U43_C04F10190 [Asparagus officinalis]
MDLDIFFAGTDAATVTLEWAMTELMRHPEVLKRAQAEVRDLVGDKGKVEETDLHQFHYLKLVVKETLRIHPPGTLLLPREITQQCKINGYDIPANSRLFVNAWTIGRDAGVWENPEVFRPERFVDSPIDFKGHHFELIPFGAGRRICPGMEIGLLVVELALANLLYVFDWELPDGMVKEDLNMDEAPGVDVAKKAPLFLVARKVY